MTHPGDEPELGGQLSGNAPMISGWQTRAIADARGAYLAGNVDRLIYLMHTDQRRRFHRLLVEQAVLYARPVIAGLGSPLDHEILAAAQRWLDQPTARSYRQTDYALRGLHYMARPRSDIAELVRSYVRLAAIYVAWCVLRDVLLDTAARAARWAVGAARFAALLDASGGAPGSSREGFEHTAALWQAEAAWAILNGAEPPPLEEPA